MYVQSFHSNTHYVSVDQIKNCLSSFRDEYDKGYVHGYVSKVKK